jgi:hypothetical protein
MNDHFIPVASRPTPNKVLAQEAWVLAADLEEAAHRSAEQSADEATEGILLVLAGAADQTAQRFVSAARRRGVDCVIPKSAEQMNIRLRAGRDGSTTCELSFGAEQLPVRAVLNRGLSAGAEGEAHPFIEAELLATWWSVLACFPGRVINRPSRMGFLPDLDVVRLTARHASLKLPRIQIATSRRVVFRTPATHIRQLSDGCHVGSFHRPPDTEFNIADVYAATEFDPLKTRQLLLAGRCLFDLAHETGEMPPGLEQQLRGLLEQLCDEQANFCLLVVQEYGNELRLVHTSPFPSAHQYQHFEDRVNQALLEYLFS